MNSFCTNILRLLCFSATFGCAALSPVYANNIDQGAGLWMNVFLEDFFKTNQYPYTLEGHVRFKNDQNHFDQTKFRFGTGYLPSKNVALWLGYDITSEQNADEHFTQEQRFWQQLVWHAQDKPNYDLIFRNRLEQRKQNGNAGIGWRLRSQCKLKFKNQLFQRVYPLISDELYFHLKRTDWVNDDIFDQNRLFIGIIIPTDHNTKWHVGYLNQFKNSDNNNELNHILYVAYSIGTY